MARVLVYERVVDAVLTETHGGPAYDAEIQDGTKIKEELIETASDANTTEHYPLVRNRSNSTDYDKSFLSKNDISNKYVGSVGQTNVERKGEKLNEEQVCDTFIKAKRKYFNDISNNDHTSAPCTTVIETSNRKRKLRDVTSDSRKKAKHTSRKLSSVCNICFRKFPNVQNRIIHQRYYNNNSVYECSTCRVICTSREKLYLHIGSHKRRGNFSHRYNLMCNFCNRKFKIKVCLQAHLFHTHRELIYSGNITKSDNSEPISASYGNSNKSEKRNTTLTNKACTCDGKDEVTKTDKALTQKSPNNEGLSTKKLRQPTLTEYLEFCKKKRDIKTSPDKLDMKSDFISALNCYNKIKGDLTSKSSEEITHSGANSLSKNLNSSLKQMAHSSTRDQNEKAQSEMCLSKKPFVRLHADVEMMKSFLESLPDTTKNEVIEDETNNIVSCDRELPYSLRYKSSSRLTCFMVKDSSPRRRKNRSVSNCNARCNTKMEQNVVDSNEVDSNFREIVVRFKYKDCTIPLTRCDDSPRNLQPVSTIATTSQQNVSHTVECNSIPFQENDTKNNTAFKKLEVSLERLATASDINDMKPKETVLDVEKQNNKCFLCKVCNKSFSSKLAKRAHIKASHIAYMSSICEARYTLKHELLRHYLREHLDKRDQCCICYNLFPDYITLKRHLAVHCLKFIQRGDDQSLLDVEIKCNSARQDHICIHCNKIFSSQSTLMEHHNFCSMKKGMQENQEDCIEETSTCPKIIFKMHCNKDIEEISVIHDEKIQHDAIHDLSNDESNKKTSEIPTSSINQDEMKINENNENSSVNNQNLIVTESDFVSEKQDPKNSSENDDTTISDIDSKSKIYPCGLCGKRFQNRKNLEHHVRTFSNPANVCPMCNTAFSSMRLLRTHITAAHVPQFSKNYNLHCMFCNQGFIKKHELRSHVLHLHGRQMLEALAPNILRNQEKSDESDKHTATCNVCNLVFETVDRYVEHRMYYYKNHKFTCSLCAQDFQGMYMYHHHTKLTHYSENKLKSYSYTCDICNEGFNHELHFYSHNMHVHLNRENLAENTETEERNRVSALQKKIEKSSMNQQKEIEQSSNDYVCQICQLKCADSDDMEEHKALYSNDGDFKCGICNRRCKTVVLLEQHKRLTHICRDVYNGHECYICGEIVATVTSLKCHEKHFHCNATRDNADDCKCKKCNQTFSSSIACKEHRCKSVNNTHDVDGNKYDCLFCDMKFSSANAIQVHIIRTHFKDLLSKTDLKPKLPATDNNQKQSAQQLVKASSREDNQASSVQRSDEISKQHTKEKTIKRKNKNTTESTIASLNQAEDVFPRVDKLREKTPTTAISTPINQSEVNILTSVATKDGENNINTSVTASVEPTNELSTNFEKTSVIPLTTSVDSSKSNPTTTKIKSSTGSIDKYEPISSSSASSKLLKPSKMISILVTPPVRRIEIIDRPELVNDRIGYACPLCLLEYPSLMFFHAHLKYFHTDSIRTSNNIPKSNQSAQETSVIECLLCPRTFVDEAMYRKHLRNLHTHYVYVPNLKDMKNANNANNLLTAQMSNDNKRHSTRNTSPELIIVDDDDSNDVENSSVKHALAETTPVTASCASSGGNENVGKLKVKPFAKIIESLSTNHALKNCSPSKSFLIQSNVPKLNPSDVSHTLRNIYKQL